MEEHTFNRAFRVSRCLENGNMGWGFLPVHCFYVSWCCQHRLRQRGRVTDCLNGGRFSYAGVELLRDGSFVHFSMKRALVEQGGS